MIKITNEIDGVLYELVQGNVSECAFSINGSCCNCTDEQSNFNDYVLCIILI